MKYSYSWNGQQLSQYNGSNYEYAIQTSGNDYLYPVWVDSGPTLLISASMNVYDSAVMQVWVDSCGQYNTQNSCLSDSQCGYWCPGEFFQSLGAVVDGSYYCWSGPRNLDLKGNITLSATSNNCSKLNQGTAPTVPAPTPAPTFTPTMTPVSPTTSAPAPTNAAPTPSPVSPTSARTPTPSAVSPTSAPAPTPSPVSPTTSAPAPTPSPVSPTTAGAPSPTSSGQTLAPQASSPTMINYGNTSGSESVGSPLQGNLALIIGVVCAGAAVLVIGVGFIVHKRCRSRNGVSSTQTKYTRGGPARVRHTNGPEPFML